MSGLVVDYVGSNGENVLVILKQTNGDEKVLLYGKASKPGKRPQRLKKLMVERIEQKMFIRTLRVVGDTMSVERFTDKKGHGAHYVVQGRSSRGQEMRRLPFDEYQFDPSLQTVTVVPRFPRP